MIDLSNQRLLVIAPHPDDETIGCGGLIKKVKDAGGKVYILFLTVGKTKDFSPSGNSGITQRKKEIAKVAKILGFDKYELALAGNKYHLQLDTYGQLKLMNLIERNSAVSIEKIKPTMIAFPSPFSYNQDHRIAAYATHAALRPASSERKYFVPIVLSYEQPADEWSLATMPQQNFFVPLEKKQIDAKTKAMEQYASQVRNGANPRSKENLYTLAKLRGAQCGTSYAESYTLYRISV